MATTTTNLPVGYSEAPAAAKNRLVGKGKGIAVEATRLPVPDFLKKPQKCGYFALAEFLIEPGGAGLSGQMEGEIRADG